MLYKNKNKIKIEFFVQNTNIVVGSVVEHNCEDLLRSINNNKKNKKILHFDLFLLLHLNSKLELVMIIYLIHNSQPDGTICNPIQRPPLFAKLDVLTIFCSVQSLGLPYQVRDCPGNLVIAVVPQTSIQIF
jgi:hypothetical protein